MRLKIAIENSEKIHSSITGHPEHQIIIISNNGVHYLSSIIVDFVVNKSYMCVFLNLILKRIKFFTTTTITTTTTV